MTQAELDESNRLLLSQFLKRAAPGEMVAAVVTVRLDAKGLGWYPAVASQSGPILDLLRQKRSLRAFWSDSVCGVA